MTEASCELLASRRDVWAFLEEPNHLSDWWPGVRGVEADRRGFAAGARWRVVSTEPPLVFARSGRGSTGRTVTQTLMIEEIAPFERWVWQLVGQQRALRRLNRTVEIRLQATSPETTLVTVGVSSGRGLARLAVDRLYELVQTAATM